ncbi:MAC/perforin domain-containing protein [Pedobacter sp. WC2423]|uniref:MAC/perforin domain-containing protein n=1 Tax=Pedobacter sp. WC2423 TaxID=3234142 RepID=UPI0034675B7C
MKPENHSSSIPEFMKDMEVVSERTGTGKIILSSKELSSGRSALTTPLSIPQPLQPEYYLGRSYRGDGSIIVDPINVSFKVIDIERLLQEHPDYYTPLNLDVVTATSSSFASFDRYEHKTNSNKTISGGFSVNLGLFSFGAKNKWTTIFTSSVVNETNAVFGELNVEVKGSSYSLLSSENAQRTIMENYLSPDFLSEVNNSSRGEFVRNYGAFVLARYYTGGKATAMYTGTDNKTTTNETKEKGMDGSINGSFGFNIKKGVDGKVGGDFGFANGSGGSTGEQHNITQLRLSIQTIGGTKGLGAFTVPKRIEDININLGDWVMSLNDHSKYNLIGINEGGLNPISDFVMEENFKKSIYLYLKNPETLKYQTKLVEPLIWIRPTYPPGGGAGTVYSMFLFTRFGEFINITPSDMLQTRFDFPSELYNSYVARKKPFFDLTYYAGGDYFIPDSDGIPVFSLTGIEENTMRKFHHDKTNTTYLLYSGGGKKYAFSIHDDYVLDTYGIRAWVNAMPTTNFSFVQLQSYTIIGL